MFGKLLKKKEPGPSQAAKLPKPRDILQPVGQALVVQHKEEPDWVWHLKCVTMDDTQVPGRELFRVFDHEACVDEGVIVKAYPSLDPYPQLVLYYGWVEKKSKKMELVNPRTPQQKAS